MKILELISNNFTVEEKIYNSIKELLEYVDQEKCENIILDLIKLKLDIQTILSFILYQVQENYNLEASKIKKDFGKKV